MSPVPDPTEDPDKHGRGSITDLPTDVSQFINLSSSSESEGEDEDTNNGHHGYQQLPQEPDAGGDDGDSHQISIDDVIQHQLSGVDPDLGYSAPSLASALGLPEEGLPVTEPVWSGENSRLESGPLPEEQAEKIKAAMVGFKLPDSQMPEWAKDIPEEVWKSQLQERLNFKRNENR